MRPIKFILLALFFCKAHIFLAQDAGDSELDPLRKAIFLAGTDTQRISATNAFTRQLIIRGDFDSAIYYNKRVDSLAAHVGFTKGLSVSYTYYGLIYFAQGNYPEAVKYYYASLRLREKLNDKAGIAATYHNLGNLFYAQGNANEAMKNYQLSLKIKRETGDTLDSHYAHTINNLGNFYEGRANFPTAMKYYEAALLIEKRIGDIPGIISAYGNIANVHTFLKEYDRAFEMYFNIERIADSMGDKQSLAAIYTSIGNLYYTAEKPREALVWLNKGLALSKEIGSKDDIKTSYGYLTDVNAYLGNHKQALYEYKMWVAYKDSLNNEENTKNMVRTQMNYEFEKKEAATRLEQEKREAIAAAESRKQRIILFAISGFGLLVLGFAVFAYRSFLQKKKANIEITRQKHLIEEKQKEILDSIHYAKRIQTALLTSELNIDRYIKKLKVN